MSQTHFVHLEFESVGYHNWPDAPQEFAYLRNLHRHVFHVAVEFDTRGDRFVEINKAQGQLLSAVPLALSRAAEPGALLLGDHSCEWLAGWLCQLVQNLWQPAWCRVLVQEDGKQGAGVIWYAKED